MIGWTIAGGAAAFTGAVAHAVFVPHSRIFGRNLSRGDRSDLRIALTFDDGPHPTATPRVLEILAREQIPATFFVIGCHAREQSELLRRVHEQGHTIANHSMRHERTGGLRRLRWWMRELNECNDAIEDAIGLRPRLFRPPVGVKCPPMFRALRRPRMQMVTWSLRGRDGWPTDADAIVQRIVPHARGGDIVLLHDGCEPGRSRDPQPTIDALPRIIQGLRDRGLGFATVDDLLHLQAFDATAAEIVSPASKG